MHPQYLTALKIRHTAHNEANFAIGFSMYLSLNQSDTFRRGEFTHYDFCSTFSLSNILIAAVALYKYIKNIKLYNLQKTIH